MSTAEQDTKLRVSALACLSRNQAYLAPLVQQKAPVIVIISFKQGAECNDAISLPGEDQLSLVAEHVVGSNATAVLAARPKSPTFCTDILIILTEALPDRLHVYGAVWQQCRWTVDASTAN
jgi:hypothetical protein